MVAYLYGIHVFACGLLHLNLDVTKENLLAAGFSAVPAVFLVVFLGSFDALAVRQKIS